MEAKLVGEFTEEQEERERIFQQNMLTFQNKCRDIVDKHKKAR